MAAAPRSRASATLDRRWARRRAASPRGRTSRSRRGRRCSVARMPLHDRADALGGQRRRRRARRRPGSARASSAHVVALVAVLGHRLVARAGADRLAELVDLRARVVEVVLAADLVAGELEHPRERVAVGGVAAAGGGQRAGRVGRDELDVYVLGRARACRGPSRRRRRAGLRAAPTYQASARKTFRKPGPGDLDAVDAAPPAARSALRAEPLGDLARRRAQRGREQHRRVGRVVAEARPSSGARASGARARARLAVAEVAGGRLDGRAQLVDRDAMGRQ